MNMKGVKENQDNLQVEAEKQAGTIYLTDWKDGNLMKALKKTLRNL